MWDDIFKIEWEREEYDISWDILNEQAGCRGEVTTTIEICSLIKELNATKRTASHLFRYLDRCYFLSLSLLYSNKFIDPSPYIPT